MTDFHKERAVAIEAALAGGEVLKSHYGKQLDISYKGGDLNLVTIADTESEETIVSILGKRLPGVAVLAEEGGESGPRLVGASGVAVAHLAAAPRQRVGRNAVEVEGGRLRGAGPTAAPGHQRPAASSTI